jgi:hypothetical protein
LKKRWDVVWVIFCTVGRASFPSVDAAFSSNRNVYATRKAARIALKEFKEKANWWLKKAKFQYGIRKYVKA